jgi:hypothetical protein
MACLVQQLFRQKIGIELDVVLVDEVLFPLLFKQKHAPKELLQDIKLTQSCNEHGLSTIVGRVCHLGAGRVGRLVQKNISPFPESCLMRRQRRADTWGSIDILNELRSLKQPQFGRHHTTEVTLDPGRITGPQDEFGGIYILLVEVPPWSCRQEKRLSDLKFMNDYLDDALNTGKCISWTVLRSGRILSTHY